MLDEEALRRLLIKHEDLKLKPYRDSVGKLTIGVGRNLDDVGISSEEAMFLLDTDIERTKESLDRSVPWWGQMNDARQIVLANMCFNLGIGRLLGFKKFLAAAKAGDYGTAAAEMLDSKWATQVGKRATELAEIMRMGVVPDRLES